MGNKKLIGMFWGKGEKTWGKKERETGKKEREKE